MKKKLSMIGGVAACFLLTGCGTDKMTCTLKTTEDEGYEITDKYEIEYNDEKVLKVTETATMEVDEELVESTLSLGETLTEAYEGIDGFEMKFEKVNDTTVQTRVIVDYEKLDLEQFAEVTGAEVGDYEFYSDLDITIDEFKEEYLSEYECK